MEHARASSEVTRRPGTNMVSIGPWGDSRDSVTAPLPSPQGEGHRGERASTEGPRFPSLSSPGAGAADPVTETATPGLSEYLSEYLWWHPFCQLPPGVTSPGPEESANEKPQQTRTAPAWGPTSCAPRAGRDAPVHSLWFGCTLGAWVHRTAGSPSSAGQTGIPGTQTALQSPQLRQSSPRTLSRSRHLYRFHLS